jgi:hypothetical protein
MSNLVSVRLEKVLASVQDRRMVCAKRTKAQKSFWTHLMVLPGDEAQLEPRFTPFGASANLDARQVQGLRRMYLRLKSHFGRIRWISSVTWVL